MIRILQINVGVRHAAQDLALASASTWGADIIVLTEQNQTHPPEAEGWYADQTDLAAIVVLGRLPINRVGPVEKGFRWVEFPDFRLYSCYCSPNRGLSEYKDFLRRLERSVRMSSAPVTVAGNFNAKASAWGSPRDDTRGSLLVNLISALDASVCKDGTSPTFVRGQSGTFIDVTFAFWRILGTIINWTVRNEESLSLHRYITYDVGVVSTTTVRPSHGWASGNIEVHQLKTALNTAENLHHGETGSAESKADDLMQRTNVCRSAGQSAQSTLVEP